MNSILIFAVLYGLVPFPLYLILRKRLPIEINYFLPFILLTFIASVYEFVFTYLLRWDSSKWFLIYEVLHFFSVFYFFSRLLRNQYLYLKITMLVLFFILLAVLLNINVGSHLDINSYLGIYLILFVFIFSIIWFQNLFKELKTESLTEIPSFYFISGLLLYECGSIVLFLSATAIYAADKTNFQYYWMLIIILNIVLRTLMIIGIWKGRTT